MIDLAYIQKAANGEFINETAYSFWYGCHMLGVETIPFQAAELDTLELRRDTLVHGWIGSVRKALQRLGVPEPTWDGAPPASIERWYGRRMWPTTMKEVRYRLEENHHIFIKPLKVQKAFSGFVTSGRVADLIKTASFEDDFEILASDVVEFVSEYRLFVHNGLIVGCKNYRGDYTVAPNFQVAQAVVQAFTDAPVAYSLDLGITDDGRTLVVEINDAFALGAYGLPSIPYAQMVISRWEQMTAV